MARNAAPALVLAIVVGACGGGTAVGDIAVGGCFDDPSADVVNSIELVDCVEPHDNEVYANLLIDESVFLGDEVLNRFAVDACLAPFEAYAGMPYAESPLDFAFLTPTADGWNNNGDRTVTCFLYSADLSKLSGSAKGS